MSKGTLKGTIVEKLTLQKHNTFFHSTHHPGSGAEKSHNSSRRKNGSSEDKRNQLPSPADLR